MTVQFDTGSALIYVLTDKCVNCPANLNKFDTKLSSTFKGQKTRITQYYGQGEVTGEIATDSMCLNN